jgi:hypothetical protein
VTLITDHVFAQKYVVVSPKKKKEPELGAIIGAPLNGILVIAIGIFIYIKLKKRRAAKAAAAATTTYPPEEPTLQMSRAPTAHELDSPEAQARTPVANTANWPIFPLSSPPAYEGKSRPMSAKPTVPQELPGSMFIHEHHPAFSTRDAPSEFTPSSPPRTPTHSAVDSEKRSPILSASTPRSEAQSPLFVSPLASPRLPQK